ncbi:NDP-hexose 2,3-dehydratase [Actinoplanes sp. ATCC 53533]|uniref:NDP-hexose 2,3-dehydratase family protein n=1 Tax=Actinoplanes sp. ATCC 53533 TaxID=1288362 RepID=UPI000387551D|nr:NDP-hexose 2,3-dehydratase family protein [Actinoplanes sp. ATCC 53533]AGS77317.1 NDP hexose dehydratase [Actinoplanes sp. ATCC 53533]RSM44296.1 NDP-hexose 2,3-dehydratase [Actinoplanes sp. ATCC 53533]
MTAAIALRQRADDALPYRLRRSAAQTVEGHMIRTADFLPWLADRARAHRFKVDRVAFDELDGWSFASGTGNLVHRTGRFFSVEGLSVALSEGPIRSWEQPIIRQPEVGILGILAKEFDGVLHFLLQAKMEPGNPNQLQLSPTVQATRSNYTGAHGGAGVRYLEHFTGPGRGRVLIDVLQSEHGSWFYRKSNRNMLVEATGDVVPHEDFRWLTLGQIGELLRLNNVVNMDSRTVIACLPMVTSESGALHSDAELQSWFTVERSRWSNTIERRPLAGIAGWERDALSIHRSDSRFFRVVAVSVEAGNREVPSWSQPLIEPTGRGVIAFLVRDIGGVPHLLVQAKPEAGFLDTVELAPTVQCDPANWLHLPAEDRPPFLDLVLAAPPERIRYEALHSEEGGRFLNAENRTLLVDVTGDEVALQPPAGFQWATTGQLGALAGHGHYLNVQARTLLSCVNAGAVGLSPR